MRLYLVYENPEATDPQETVKAYCEIAVDKNFFDLPSEQVFKIYFEPAIENIRQLIQEVL